MLEDKLLIWKFKRGDKDALRRIYEKYRCGLLKLGVVLAHDAETAEDAVQDAFVQLAQSADMIRVSGSLKNYLATCVANRIRNRRRDERRYAAEDIAAQQEVVCESEHPERWAILSEELRLLSAAMAQLSVEQREVIALYMAGGMRFRQIAKLQGISTNTVQDRYRYGLKRLRSLMNGEVTK